MFDPLGQRPARARTGPGAILVADLTAIYLCRLRRRSFRLLSLRRILLDRHLGISLAHRLATGL